MKRNLVPVFLMIILTACSATTTPLQIESEPVAVSTESGTSAVRTDQQGAIVIEITPINLDAPKDTLDFDVTLNTHSIDLSMDLATLAALSTDTGITVPATAWDAPRGGHHVEGRLVFPATSEGKPIFEGARKLTLTVINVDVPTRVFEWELK